MKPRTIIVITGPTAVGKTSMAVKVARHFHTEIISADSRQCYRELNIGVAKPSGEELHLVKHHFVNSHSIQDELNAAFFEQYALNITRQIFSAGELAVMVGGTGLYIKAFCEGLDNIPPVPTSIRDEILANYQKAGIHWLQNQVRLADPVYFSSGEIMNPQRLMRALEVKLGTGKSIREFQQHKKAERDFNIIKVGLELPREQLYARINDRVDQMIDNGLVQEVETLVQYRSLTALQTVGYSEIFKYLDGEISLGAAIEMIKKNTRHYAKRQLTWFRKDALTMWCSPDNAQKIIDLYQTAVR